MPGASKAALKTTAEGCRNAQRGEPSLTRSCQEELQGGASVGFLSGVVGGQRKEDAYAYVEEKGVGHHPGQ